MESLWLWYVEVERLIKALSYLAVMLFFTLWGLWAARYKEYHRAIIKLLLSLVMFSFVIRSFTDEPRWSLWLTTPTLFILAVTVLVFLVRMKR